MRHWFSATKFLNMPSKADLPRSRNLIWPIVQVLKESGGKARKSEIDSLLVVTLEISNDLVMIPHDKSRTELQYRSAWALSYGKRAGYFENPDRNVWALSEAGNQLRSSEEIRV